MKAFKNIELFTQSMNNKIYSLFSKLLKRQNHPDGNEQAAKIIKSLRTELFKIDEEWKKEFRLSRVEGSKINGGIINAAENQRKELEDKIKQIQTDYEEKKRIGDERIISFTNVGFNFMFVDSGNNSKPKYRASTEVK